MAMKRKLTKEEYTKLADGIKEQYTESGDSYILDLEGDDDTAELRRARDREKADKKKAQDDLKKAQARLKELEGDDEGDEPGEDDEGEGDRRRRPNKRKTTDIAKLQKAWDDEKGELSTKLSSKDEFIKKQMVNAAANEIASRISSAPTLMSKALLERLTVSFDGDEPELVILDKDGQSSKLTTAQLEKEFVANKEFAAIIIGSKASGGGAPRGSPDSRPPGGGASETQKPVDLSKASAKDLAAHLKAKREAASEA
jgi:hypothetical protein